MIAALVPLAGHFVRSVRRTVVTYALAGGFLTAALAWLSFAGFAALELHWGAPVAALMLGGGFALAAGITLLIGMTRRRRRPVQPDAIAAALAGLGAARTGGFSGTGSLLSAFMAGFMTARR